MNHPLLSPCNDFVFKKIFGNENDTDPLIDFLKATLDLPPEDLHDILIVELSNLAEINSLELPKLPQNTDGSPLWGWLRFMITRNREELDMLTKQNPQITKAAAKQTGLSESRQIPAHRNSRPQPAQSHGNPDDRQ